MLVELALGVLPFTWIVDANNGPGTHFTDLPAAVAAAGNGDTLLVRAGLYTAFEVSDKSLTLRGDGPLVTRITRLTAGGGTTSITVPAMHTFVLSGIGFAPAILPSLGGGALGIRGAGSVALLQCRVTGTNPPLNSVFSPSGLIVDGNAVQATDCQFVGGSWTSVLPIVSVGSGAIVVSGTLVATACFFRGGSFNGASGRGGSGLHVGAGNVALHECTVGGGTGAAPATGGSGISIISGTAVVAGTTGDVVRAGEPFRPGARDPGGTAIDAGAGTAFVHGPVTLVPPTGGPMTTGNVLIGQPDLPRLDVAATSLANGEIRVGTPISVSVDGTAGAPLLLGFADQSVFLTIPNLTLGPVLIAPQQFGFAVVLDGTGHFAHQFPGAAMPAFVGTPVYGQAAELDLTANRVRMSNLDMRIYTP